MEEILLVGGGGHCRSVIDVIEQEGRFSIAGIIDKPELLNTKVFDYRVIGNDDNLVALAKDYKYAFITVGQIYSANVRKKLFKQLTEAGYFLPTIVSPRAYISRYATVGDATVIMHDAIINAGAIVGSNCIINTRALVEHDSVVEDHCHVSTGAIINGGVLVKSETFIGSLATTKEAIILENGSFIKAGSIVK